MLRVLNCGTNEELRALRHQVIARSDCCEVVSPSLQEAVARLRNGEHFDVLVVCQMVNQFADVLCVEFRRANPAGRIIGTTGGLWITKCESDITVDAREPSELVAAVTSYAASKAKFKNERLIFSRDGKWADWQSASGTLCRDTRVSPKRRELRGS